MTLGKVSKANLSRDNSAIFISTFFYFRKVIARIKVSNKSKRFTEKSTIEKHYTKNKKGMLMMSDPQIIETQKGIMKEIMGQALKSWSFRSGFSGFSLPVKIFLPDSQVKNVPHIFGNFQYLYDAFNAFKPDETEPSIIKSQKLERMKYIISFIFSGFYHGATECKLFNPYLGETFQGYFDDGTQVYVEHINHSPPMDSFYICNERTGIKVYGTLVSAGNFCSFSRNYKVKTLKF